jgi:hypothetical protein
MKCDRRNNRSALFWGATGCDPRPDKSPSARRSAHIPWPWSEMDLFDLRNSLAYGDSIEDCRVGTVEEVKRNSEELGLLK